MPHYKDQNNKLHFLASAEFEHLLPSGCTAITDAEATTIKSAEIAAGAPAARKAAILTQLAEIDAKSIRSLAEGDTAYLATLRAPVAALRVELAGLV